MEQLILSNAKSTKVVQEGADKVIEVTDKDDQKTRWVFGKDDTLKSWHNESSNVSHQRRSVIFTSMVLNTAIDKAKFELSCPPKESIPANNAPKAGSRRQRTHN